MGFLGPGPLARHVEHARAMAGGLPLGARRLLDLGSGGGVPGLVLAADADDVEMVLLDAGRRRCHFLREAVEALALGRRVEVVEERAEAAARRPDLRGGFDAVVARSFGPPPVTAECAVGFLRPGGALVVSEPPAPDPARWPEDGLAALGLAPPVPCPTPAGGFVRLDQIHSYDRWPRRTGIPAKRPVW